MHIANYDVSMVLGLRALRRRPLITLREESCALHWTLDAAAPDSFFKGETNLGATTDFCLGIVASDGPAAELDIREHSKEPGSGASGGASSRIAKTVCMCSMDSSVITGSLGGVTVRALAGTSASLLSSVWLFFGSMWAGGGVLGGLARRPLGFGSACLCRR